MPYGEDAQDLLEETEVCPVCNGRQEIDDRICPGCGGTGKSIQEHSDNVVVVLEDP